MKYRLLKAGETTDPKQGDQFQERPKKWVPTGRDGRIVHQGLVGAYRRPIRRPNMEINGGIPSVASEVLQPYN